MEPLIIFSKQVISRTSTISGEEVDYFATSVSNLVHIGATYGELTLFFKDSNTYSDNSLAGGAKTKFADYARVLLRVRAGNEAGTIDLLQRKLREASNTGQMLKFDNITKEYAIKGVLEVTDILRDNVDVSDLDDDVTLICGGMDFDQLDPANIDVANDHFMFFDADDDNTTKVESISDFVQAIAGTGITATNGVLSVEETSDHVIVSDIVVTNLNAEIGDAQGPKTYVAGTLIEDILRDILSDYYPSTATLTGLKLQYETTTEDTFGTEQSSGQTYTNIEVGRAIKLTGFNYSISKPDQTANTSVTFYQNGGQIESGFLDSSSTGALASSLFHESHAEQTLSYKISVIDDGSGTNITVNSNTRYLRWLYRVKVGALDTVDISTESEAQSLYDDLITTDAFDNITTKQNIATQGTQYTFTQGYHTWVIFPAVWDLDNIVQAGQPVLADFEYMGDFDIDNGYTDASNKITYSFWVTTYERAFLEGENITISFL